MENTTIKTPEIGKFETEMGGLTRLTADNNLADLINNVKYNGLLYIAEHQTAPVKSIFMGTNDSSELEQFASEDIKNTMKNNDLAVGICSCQIKNGSQDIPFNVLQYGNLFYIISYNDCGRYDPFDGRFANLSDYAYTNGASKKTMEEFVNKPLEEQVEIIRSNLKQKHNLSRGTIQNLHVIPSYSLKLRKELNLKI